MTVNKIINNRVPHVALQAPSHGSAKKKESFSWQRPLLYTALAVAGAAAVFFVANGWGSAPTPRTPPNNPPPPPKPNQEPKGGKNAVENQEPSPPAPNAVCSEECLKTSAFFEAMLSMNTLEEVENYLKNMDPKMIPDAFQDKKVDYITFGKFFALANLDSKRQDCPDLTKVCPVPTRLLVMDRELGDNYEFRELKDINQYAKRIFKEDCPRYMTCEGKYCTFNITRMDNPILPPS